MMATNRRNSCLLPERCVFLLLVIFAAVAADEDCDVTKCPGPLRYYKDLGCKPIYENPGDCCAVRYDCDHLKARKPDKCYVNGHEYDIGEKLKQEDANPCDIGCTCVASDGGAASFRCTVVDCFHGPIPDGCYYQHTPTQCCPHPLVCPEKPEDRAKCVVDGQTYLDGEYFTPKDNPELNCNCGPGYKGENVEPFCKKPNRAYCDPTFRRAGDVKSNCAPVYYESQPPQTSCSVFSRCQNPKDSVVRGESKTTEAPEEMTCKFGDLRMLVGDELNQSTHYSSVCVKCVCQVPPVPTCQRLPDSECDVTNHPKFER